ncbi:hypothetical protein GE061_008688, partial [Apolygus lucorum]
GQKCLRKCSNDEDCKSKKKKCLCDGVCGMSCIKPERESKYSCDPGQHLVGLKERTCRGDGEWSGAPAQCKHNIFCKEAPELPHARHNALPEQTTFPLETVLQYQCSHGYSTKGFSNAKCLAIDKRASWYGPDISCQPKSCGSPQDPSNGYHSGDCYTYGCKTDYHCMQGYELVGRGERTCQADGTWLPREMPACVLVTAVECPVPENPAFGNAVYTSCQYNSVVSYECRYGYTLVGEQTRRCGPDRKWSGNPPKCQVIDCGRPPPLYQGWIENLEGGTGLGASIIFRCQEGMTLVGNTSSVCQTNGTWRYPTPRCLAPCVIPKVDQGRVIFESNSSLNQIPHGQHLEIQCESRYEPNTMDAPLVCNNGTWSHMPKCLPARCKYLPKAPKNGFVIAPKTEHGMKARFSCKDGFAVKGEQTTECRYGNWTGEQPYCQEVYCPFPGYVDHGKILLVGNMGLYDYRPYVRKVANNKQHRKATSWEQCFLQIGHRIFLCVLCCLAADDLKRFRISLGTVLGDSGHTPTSTSGPPPWLGTPGLSSSLALDEDGGNGIRPPLRVALRNAMAGSLNGEIGWVGDLRALELGVMDLALEVDATGDPRVTVAISRGSSAPGSGTCGSGMAWVCSVIGSIGVEVRWGGEEVTVLAAGGSAISTPKAAFNT